MGGREVKTAAPAASAGPGCPRVSESGPPVMSPRLAGGRRPWWIWAAPFALVLTVLVVRSRFLFTDRFYEDVDAGANSLLIQQAMHFTLLIGNYSREGFNHPGPAWMYVQAAGQWLFQYALPIVPTAWNAHVLGVFALNSAWVSMIIGVVYGWTRSLRGAAVCLAVVLGLVATEPWILSYDWMPWMYVPAYTAFLVAAASVAAGASRDLWILTLAGWFLIHGHACFLFFVPVIIAAVLATVVWRHGPRALLKAFLRTRVWVPVAVISAVFALPIAVDLTLHWPGDFGTYLSYTSSSKAGGHDPVQVVRYALWFWWRDGRTRAVALVPVVLYAVAIAAAGWLSRGAVRRFLAALLAVNVVSTVAFACYAAVGIDYLQEYYIGYFYFSAPIITLLVIAVAVVHAPPTPLGAVLAGGVAALGVAAFALAPATAVNTGQTDPALPGAVRAVAARADGKTAVIRFNHDAWADVTGFLVQAERTGVRACVQNPAWTFMMTRQFICTPGQVAGGAPFWFNSPAAPRGTAVIATLKNSQVIAGSKPLAASPCTSASPVDTPVTQRRERPELHATARGAAHHLRSALFALARRAVLAARAGIPQDPGKAAVMPENDDRSSRRRWKLRQAGAWVGAVAVYAAAQGVSAWAAQRQSGRSTRPQYSQLERPAFAPPGAAFPVVWSALNLTTATSAWRIWRALEPGAGEPSRGEVLTWWAAAVVIRSGYVPLAFGRRSLRAATADAALLFAVMTRYALLACRIDQPAALLALPEVAWTAFATVLSTAVAAINSQ